MRDPSRLPTATRDASLPAQFCLLSKPGAVAESRPFVVVVPVRPARGPIRFVLLPALAAGVSLASGRSGGLFRFPAGLAHVAFAIAIALIAHVTSVPRCHARGAHSTVIVRKLDVPFDQLHGLGEPPAAGLLALRVADPVHVRLPGKRRERVVVGARPRVPLEGGFE